MKHQLLGLLFFVAAKTGAMAEATADFPIVLACQNAAFDQLDIGLSLAHNTAYFSYKGPQFDRALIMTFSDPRSYISGSGVAIKSESMARGGTFLQISAQMNEVFRVTNYSQFFVELVINTDGTIAPKLLSYAQGIDAFPEDAITGTVNLAEMTCTLKGL